MGFFKNRKLQRHKLLILQAAENIVAEDERVYRNQVALFGEESGAPVAVSGIGLYKARLFGACFPLFAFTSRWSDEDREWFEVLQMITGLAVSTLVGFAAVPTFSVEHARELAPSFMKAQFAFIRAELTDGPSRPPTPTLAGVEAYASAFDLPAERTQQLLASVASPQKEAVTAGFLGLVDTCHQALSDSIGAYKYTSAVRLRFDTMLKGSVYGRLRLMAQIGEALA